MKAEPRPDLNRRSRSLAQLERDRALERISRTRRWLLAGAAALTAGFAALVSAIAPGKSYGARRSTPFTPARARGHAGTRTAAALPPLASPSSLGLQGPGQPPAPASSDGGSGSSGGSSSGAGGSAQPAPAPSVQSAPVPGSPPPVSGGS
jgi:uncharacterized membrane protein YgcG